MLKLIIFLTVVLISSFTAVDLMASEDVTLNVLQDELWVQGLVEEEIQLAQPEDYLPEELAVALEREIKI